MAVLPPVQNGIMPIYFVCGPLALASATPTLLADIIAAWFVANRGTEWAQVQPAPGNNLAFNKINVVNVGTTVVNYGDRTTSTTVGVPIVAPVSSIPSSKYEQDYAGRNLIDANNRVLCSLAGAGSVVIEFWR